MTKYNFDDYEKDELTKPRDKAWDNWVKFETVGDKVQGFIRDVFYRPEDGDFSEARGITLETPDKELVNVSIKRFPFILSKTDSLRMGDPLTVVYSEQKAPSKKGYSGVKVFEYYGANLPENKDELTVKELEEQDMLAQGSEPDTLDNYVEEVTAEPETETTEEDINDIVK